MVRAEGPDPPHRAAASSGRHGGGDVPDHGQHEHGVEIRQEQRPRSGQGPARRSRRALENSRRAISGHVRAPGHAGGRRADLEGGRPPPETPTRRGGAQQALGGSPRIRWGGRGWAGGGR